MLLRVLCSWVVPGDTSETICSTRDQTKSHFKSCVIFLGSVFPLKLLVFKMIKVSPEDTIFFFLPESLTEVFTLFLGEEYHL